MTPNSADSSNENDDTSGTDSPVNRRNLLGALGVATGFSALTRTATATGQDVDCGADGRVRTRGCSDESLTGKDWSTGAVTIQACPNGRGGTATLRVTGRLGYDRYGQPQQSGGTGGQSAQGSQSQRVVVTQGQEMDAGSGTAEQTQTVIIEQDQSMSGGGGSSLPEVQVTLRPGEKRTLWYTGSIAGFSTSNDNLNIGIANRPD